MDTNNQWKLELVLVDAVVSRIVSTLSLLVHIIIIFCVLCMLDFLEPNELLILMLRDYTPATCRKLTNFVLPFIVFAVYRCGQHAQNLIAIDLVIYLQRWDILIFDIIPHINETKINDNRFFCSFRVCIEWRASVCSFIIVSHFDTPNKNHKKNLR